MKCCFIPCDAEADYEVYGESGDLDDNTLACEAHIGALLGTPMHLTRENRSWTVSVGPRLAAKIAEREAARHLLARPGGAGE